MSARRSAAAVLAAAITVIAIGASIPEAAALDAIGSIVSTTTTALGGLVDGITGDGQDASASTTTTTSSTTSTSSTSTTSTTTTSTTSSTTTTTIAPPTTTSIPNEIITSASPVVAGPAGTVAPAAGTPLPALADVGARLHEPPGALPAPHGPRSTLDVLDALRSRGATPSLVARVLAPFPVAGSAHYTDDWGLPRHGPPPHPHGGCDIFAERGTPVIASMDGVLGRMTTTSSLGGTSLRLTTPSGTYFYYAHLDRFAPLRVNGARVRAGDVIGFVGNTGNAATTAPHLHFEIHPLGGAAVPPVPYLDRWLAEAMATSGAITGSTALLPALAPVAQADDLVALGGRQHVVRPPKIERLETTPVRSIEPNPLFAFAGVLVLFSWLAQRGRRGARRRAAGRR